MEGFCVIILYIIATRQNASWKRLRSIAIATSTIFPLFSILQTRPNLFDGTAEDRGPGEIRCESCTVQVAPKPKQERVISLFGSKTRL